VIALHKRDSVTALCWVVLGSVIVLKAITFPLGRWESIGPAIFPLGAGIVLIVLGGILFLQSRGNGKRGPDERPASIIPRGSAFTRVAMSVVAILLAATFLQFLGFFFTMFCLALSLTRAIQPRRWGVDLFYAVVFTAGSYLLFQVLLKVSFPVGLLGF
jgi:putative tricarboxylic transport membrane protein